MEMLHITLDIEVQAKLFSILAVHIISDVRKFILLTTIGTIYRHPTKYKAFWIDALKS